MSRRAGGRVALGLAVALCTSASDSVVHAQDFFSALFGAFGDGRPHAPPSARLPFGSDNPVVVPRNEVRPRAVYSGGQGGQAFCVRTCDGRYFPVNGPDNQSRAASCNSFCPASETKLVYGSDINDAETESGTSYSEFRNAFRYRNEIVAGCTCNGKDQIGLAAVKIENDPTLRKGDLVVGKGGLMVAGRSADKRGASHDFSPAPAQLRSRYQPVPIVAAE